MLDKVRLRHRGKQRIKDKKRPIEGIRTYKQKWKDLACVRFSDLAKKKPEQNVTIYRTN